MLIILGSLAALAGVALAASIAFTRYRARRNGIDPALRATAPVYLQDADGRTDFRPELRLQTIARREKADAARRHAKRVDSGGASLTIVNQRKEA